MSTQTPETTPSIGAGDSKPLRFPEPARPGETQLQVEAQTLETNLPILEADGIYFEQKLAELKAEQQQILERTIGLEEQNSALTTLYVACQRLHSTLERAEVLLTVREIIANLIGCEEYVLFSLAPDGSLCHVDSFGLDPRLFETCFPLSGLIGRAVEARETYVHQDNGGSGALQIEANLTACIPLKRNGAVTGAVALFRLLPQKLELLELDRELFRLLESHLAIALYCSELEQRVGTKNGVAA